MSRSQDGPQGPAVAEGGKCLRIIYAEADQHTVHHTWSPDAARGLQLTTQRKDPSVNGGWVKGSKVYVPAFENALSKMAKEKAHEFMHAKRETAKRSASPSDKEEGGQEEEGQDEGVGPRRSGRAKTKSKRLHDQGYRSSSSGEEEGESESDVESDVDGSEEEYTEREKAGGAESSEEEEEEEEEESERSVSGVETVRVEKVTVDHKVNIASASRFCSACRPCDYGKCCVRANYPALVPEFKLAVGEEVLVVDTGVDPSGVDVGVGGKRKKAR